MTSTHEMEWELVGGCVHEPSYVDMVSDLPGLAFSDARTGHVWDAIVSLCDNEVGISRGTVREWLSVNRGGEAAGGGRGESSQDGGGSGE